MDVNTLNSVVWSAGIATLIAIGIRMLPLRAPNGSVKAVGDKVQDLSVRYDELQAENQRLRDELQKKLIEYTNAYHEWTHRETEQQNHIRMLEAKESEYQQRIRLLEAKVEQLRTRIKGLESRAQIEQPDSQGDEDRLVVLGIWPDQELSTDAEADALYNAGYEYVPIRGAHATRSGIIQELRRLGKDRPLIIEIGAHGTEVGTTLHEGDIVKPGWWRRVLGGREIRLVALMSCESIKISDALVAAGIPAVISMQDKIADDDAVLFVRELYSHLSQHGDIGDAVEYARLHVSQAAWEMIRFREGSK